MRKREAKDITIEIVKKDSSYDHDTVNFKNQGFPVGFGYLGRSNKRICLIRCPLCSLENYGPVVVTGMCAFCGYNPNTDHTD